MLYYLYYVLVFRSNSNTEIQSQDRAQDIVKPALIANYD